MTECIFCKIIEGSIPSHKIWEDDQHVAFLTIFPNTPGFTVMASKEHLPSYFAENTDERLAEFVLAAKKVAHLLDRKLSDVGRTGLIFEGFGVDHLHAKFFPMHGTNSEGWEQHNSEVAKFFDIYEGYISSHNGPRAEDTELEELADRIRD